MKKRLMCLLLALLMAATALTGCAEAIQIENNAVPLADTPGEVIEAVPLEAEPDTAAQQAAADAAAQQAAADAAAQQAAADAAAQQAAADEAARQAAEQAAAEEAARQAAEQAAAEEAARQAAEQAAAEEAARQAAEQAAAEEAARQAAEQAAAEEAAQQAEEEAAKSEPVEEAAPIQEAEPAEQAEPIEQAPAAEEPAAELEINAVTADEPMTVAEVPEPTEKVTIKLMPAGGVFPQEIDQTRGYIEVELSEAGQLTVKDIANRVPTREGYSFDGWYTAENGGGDKVTFSGDTANVKQGTAALYANWTLIPRTVLLHIVNGSLGGTWEGKSVEGEVSVEVKLNGNQLPDVSAITATRSHGKFLGWYTAAPTEELKHDQEKGYSYYTTVTVNGSPVAANTDVPMGVTILYAVFEDNQEVTEEDERVTFYLDWNGIKGMWGHCLTATRKYDSEKGGYELSYEDLAVRYLNWDGELEGQTFSDMATLKQYWEQKNAAGGFNGYIFKGWAKSPTATVPDVEAGEVIKDGDSIYAVWVKGEETSDKFDRTDPNAGPLTSMHLSANGGSHSNSSMDWNAHASSGSSITVTTARAPSSRATYKTMTWTVSSSLGNETLVYDVAKGAAETKILGGVITLTANGADLKVQYTGGKDAPSKTAIRLTVNAVATNMDESQISNSGLPVTIYFGHDWDGGKVTKQAQKCGEYTDTLYTCNCGATYTQSVKKEHLFSAKIVDKEPTCTDTGTQTWYCSKMNEDGTPCNAKGGSSSIPALGHSWVKDTSVDPVIVDCRHSEYTYKCNRGDCGATEKRTEWTINSDYSAHKWGEWYTVMQATYLDDGTQRRDCSVCHTSEFQAIHKRPVSEATGVAAIVTVNGARYCADASGYAKTGMQSVNGKRYYFNPSNGVMATGWQNVDGGMHYFGSDGAMVTGLQTIGGSSYYFNSNGVRQTGWISLGNGNYYYANGSGVVQKNAWLQYNGGWYWLKADGKMARNEKVTISGSDYYFNNNGIRQTGWVSLGGGNYYYANGSGVIQKSQWLKNGSTWYWLKSDGKMARNEKVRVGGADYYFYNSGVMGTGWINLGGGNYYYGNSSGALLENQWLKLGNTWYWLKSGGMMARNEKVRVGGADYYFYNSGAMGTGWINIGSGNYYYANSSGALVKGQWLLYNNEWYWLKSDGMMARNEKLTIGGAQYMFKNSGVMYTGWINLGGGDYYYANSSGAIQTNKWVKYNGEDYYLKSDGMMARNEYISIWHVNDSGVWDNK